MLVCLIRVRDGAGATRDSDRCGYQEYQGVAEADHVGQHLKTVSAARVEVSSYLGSRDVVRCISWYVDCPER